MSYPKILIIVPAYNEAGNIRKTLKEILSLKLTCVVLVINDGSRDQTALEAKKAGVCVVSLPFNIGIGGAMQTGFQFALEENFDIAVQVDGDGQHDVAYLTKILEPVLCHQADMAVGSRFLPPNLGYQSSVIRRIGINFFARLISFLTGVKITDSTSGFRVYNRTMIKIFAQYYPHDFPEPEAIVVAKSAGAKIVEVPVVMRQRQAGRSSIRYLYTLYYMIKVTFAILLNRLKKKRKAG